MKRIKIIGSAVLAVLLFCGCNQEPISPPSPGMIWQSDYTAAFQQAKKENKYILVYLSGKEWCHFCQALDEEILSQPEFLSYAKNNLICVQMDFDLSGRATDPQFAQQNEAFLEKYMVEGFPAVFIFSPQGQGVARDGYHSVSPSNYVAAINHVIAADKSK